MACLSPHTNRPTTTSHPEVPVFWCEICSVKMDNPHKAYQHLINPKHRAKTGFISNGLKEGVDPHHCDLCDVALNSAISAQDHYNSKKHLNRVKLKEDRESNGSVMEKDGVPGASHHCPQCGVTSNSALAAEAHLKGKKHINRMAMLGKFPLSSNAQVDHMSSRDDVMLKGGQAKKGSKGASGKVTKVVQTKKGPKEITGTYCNHCKVLLNSDLQEAAHYDGLKHKINAGLVAAPPGWEEKQQPGYWLEQAERKRHQYLGLGATIDKNNVHKYRDSKRVRDDKYDKNKTLAEKAGGVSVLFSKGSLKKYFVSASRNDSFAAEAKPGISRPLISREQRERQMELDNEAREMNARMAQNPYAVPQRQVGPATYYHRQDQTNGGGWNVEQPAPNNYTWNDPNDGQNQANNAWHVAQPNAGYDNSWYDQNTNASYDNQPYGHDTGQGYNGSYDGYRPTARYDPYMGHNNNNAYPAY